MNDNSQCYISRQWRVGHAYSCHQNWWQYKQTQSVAHTLSVATDAKTPSGQGVCKQGLLRSGI